MRFTDAEVEELRGLVADEGSAYWRTGDWLVRKIDTPLRTPGSTQHNGRDEEIHELAQKADVGEAVLRTRYLTSRCFPSGDRHLDLSWTLHRRFAEQGEDKAVVWMEEFLDTGVPPTIRAASAWMERVKDRKTNAGHESAAAIARSITAVSDPAAKAAEVVSALPAEVQAAIVVAAATVAPKAAARAVLDTVHREVRAEAELEANLEKVGVRSQPKPVDIDPQPEWQRDADKIFKAFQVFRGTVSGYPTPTQAVAWLYVTTKVEEILMLCHAANPSAVPDTAEGLFQ